MRDRETGSGIFCAAFCSGALLAAAGDAKAYCCFESYHPSQCWIDQAELAVLGPDASNFHGVFNGNFTFQNFSLTDTITATCPVNKRQRLNNGLDSGD